MKITQSQLRQLINEEIQKATDSTLLNEYEFNTANHLTKIYQKIQALEGAVEIIEFRLDELRGK